MQAKIKTELVNRLKIYSRVFAFIVFLVGVLGIFGWQYNILLLKRIHPAFPDIAPNTSFCLFLAGLVILFISKADRKVIFRRILLLASTLIGIVGLLTLLEYVLGSNLLIDRILFFKSQGETVVRMSPQSSFNFLMLGLSLFLILRSKKDEIRLGQLVVLVTGELALLSLFGYIYNLPSFYTFLPYKGMAAHTAFSFFLVFVAVLTSHPREGFVRVFITRSIGGLAARSLLLTLFLIILTEILINLGRQLGFYENNLESLLHLFVVASAFLYLILTSLRTLDRLSEMEVSIAKMREIDKAKTEFVSLASHQLRTPLTSVSWYSEMLLRNEEGPLSLKQREYLDEVYTQNRRMIDLVDDLLNSSRIDMGMLEIESKKVRLQDIAESVIQETNPLAKKKNIQIEKDFSADLENIRTDPEMVRIIFQNLLSNAVKYTPEGGRVSISLSPFDSYIKIKVSDTGYGIPKRQQGRIFTKMFRADNIRNKVTDGTGLGLYIVKSIVKELGGRIYFTSREGKGTDFFVNLPIKKYSRITNK